MSSVGTLPDGGYFVEDDGRGIDGEPEEIARLFSIARPMISTKLLRLPTRGALGNGLRVVAGAVLASDGFLVVTTRNRRIELRPERDGSTTVVSVTPVEFPVGTRDRDRLRPGDPGGRQRAATGRSVATEMARGHVLHRQVVAVVVRRPAVSRAAVGERRPRRCANWWPSSTAALAAGLARSSPMPGSAAWPATMSAASRPAGCWQVARDHARDGQAEAARRGRP